MSKFDEMGGHETFEKLVSHFYALVTIDPILRPMYPEDDIKGAAERLLMFLEQYWGGPTTYSERRGHPRLRMRHSPFQIGEAEKIAWLKNMESAVAELDLSSELRSELWSYLTSAAEAMVNQPRLF